MNYDVIIVGGGASGIMAAITAAEQGKKVLLLNMAFLTVQPDYFIAFLKGF